jgi:hypothetical protein
MRTFLRTNFNTDKVTDVEFADLKAKIDGPSLLSRIAYRR